MRTECPFVNPLPEALLSGKQQIGYASHDDAEALSHTDMTKEVWTDSEHQSAPLLTELFSNALILSRLEIVHIVLEALASSFSGGDVAYVLMGLLNQSTEFVKSNTKFQTLASLSLVNDSDQSMERMVSMFLRYDNSRRLGLQNDSLTSTQVPVATLGHQTSLSSRWRWEDKRQSVLDNCRGVSIRCEEPLSDKVPPHWKPA